MLTVRDVTVRTLGPMSFDLPSGACLAIQGASGSGKSLLLRAIADLDPSDGAVSLDGTARAAMPAPAWRRRVVYVATDAGWWLDRVDAHFTNWAAIAKDLAPLGLAADCGTWPVSRLSTGERQRLALLRALAPSPRVLLLDEPTSGLDMDTTRAVEAMIAARRQRELAVVWVTHDDAQARRVGDRILAIRDGALIPA